MRDLANHWYVLLSTLNAAVNEPLGTLAFDAGIPLLSALLFGLLGATAPCQLTTTASALAYVARGAADRRYVAQRTLAYVAGKALVYTVVGAAVIMAGHGLAQASVPVIVVARKMLGPAMILLGLYFFGLVPLSFSVGTRISSCLEARAAAGLRGAFTLGVAFAFAFCPTLFLLFFGLTLPLALGSPVGVVYPAVFALGTTLPLLALSAVLALGFSGFKSSVGGVRRVNAWLRPISATVLVLAGINDTLVYWLL